LSQSIFGPNKKEEDWMSGFHFYAFPVLVAAVIQFAIGAIWYGVGFRKRWTALAGHTGEAKMGRAAFEMIASFILSVVISAILANVIDGLGNLLWGGNPSFSVGASVAVMCWFGFIAPPMLMQAIFERRPVNLFAINAGYWIVAMAVSGGVLAVMTRA
jgi:Protein of unknown function (DUF1761)